MFSPSLISLHFTWKQNVFTSPIVLHFTWNHVFSPFLNPLQFFLKTRGFSISCCLNCTLNSENLETKRFYFPNCSPFHLKPCIFSFSESSPIFLKTRGFSISCLSLLHPKFSWPRTEVCPPLIPCHSLRNKRFSSSQLLLRVLKNKRLLLPQAFFISIQTQQILSLWLRTSSFNPFFQFCVLQG